MTDEKITLTVKEAGKRLGCGNNKAYELVRSGRLRSIQLGKKFLIPVREIDDFLEREMSLAEAA